MPDLHSLSSSHSKDLTGLAIVNRLGVLRVLNVTRLGDEFLAVDYIAVPYARRRISALFTHCILLLSERIQTTVTFVLEIALGHRHRVQ